MIYSVVVSASKPLLHNHYIYLNVFFSPINSDVFGKNGISKKTNAILVLEYSNQNSFQRFILIFPKVAILDTYQGIDSLHPNNTELFIIFKI